MSEIIVDTSDLEKIVEQLPLFPREAHAAMNAALNRTTSRVVTNILKDVANEYAIKRPQVRKTIGVKKSRVSTLTAEVDVTGSRIKMGSFQFTHAENRYRSPVSVKIKKSNGMVTSNSQPPLFVGKGQVYHRTPHDKYKVGWAFSLSVPQMVSNDEVYNTIADDAHEFLMDRFNHELQYRLKKTLGV